MRKIADQSDPLETLLRAKLVFKEEHTREVSIILSVEGRMLLSRVFLAKRLAHFSPSQFAKLGVKSRLNFCAFSILIS